MRAWFLKLAVLVALTLSVGEARAADREEILLFKSRITVEQSGTLHITETIQVRATGDKIKRGIYRDLPTSSVGPDGATVRTDYHIQSITRDGATLSYFETGEGPGRRIYFGSKDTFIKPGVYTYRFTYRVPRQVRFLEAVDEIYWNVTGNDWDFPILSAEAEVELPPGVKPVQYHGYTGDRGETGQDYRYSLNAIGHASFVTTRPFSVGQGLTVAVGWPKGFVAQPDAAQKTAGFLIDNLPSIVAMVGLILTLAYYLFAWDRVGRDPVTGPIVPLFEPPKGYSPALMRVLMNMGYDDKAFAAAIVDMGVKGVVRIDDDDGVFTLSKVSNDASQLSKGEAIILKTLLVGSSALELKRKNHSRIGSAVNLFKSYLTDELETTHFNTNVKYLIPGAGLSLLTIAAAALTMPSSDAAVATVFMSVWLTVWTVGCFVLVRRALAAWRAGAVLRALGQSLFAVPFIGGEFFGFGILMNEVSLAFVVFLAGMAGLFGLFYHLMKAPTLKGRRVMDQIEGFKMYLSVAEKDRLAMFHPPEETPERFEKFLPYALALGVEHAWSERFAELLNRAGRADDYHPGWYGGHGFDHGGISGFADRLGGGFSSALGASAQSPSSGGSGGGGSSGGGGGGGGGGGF